MIAVSPVGRWGRFPTFQAKVGTGSSSCILVRRTRRFSVGQFIAFAEEHHLAGMATGCTPKWRRGRVWKIEDDRLFIELI